MFVLQDIVRKTLILCVCVMMRVVVPAAALSTELFILLHISVVRRRVRWPREQPIPIRENSGAAAQLPIILPLMLFLTKGHLLPTVRRR